MGWTGVAMGNAIPAVKEVATLVAPMTNDQDAVAWAIENYVLKESESMGLFDRLFGKKEETEKVLPSSEEVTESTEVEETIKEEPTATQMTRKSKNR